MARKLFAMVTTKDSALYTPHAVSSLFRTTEFDEQDTVVLIDNDSSSAALPPSTLANVELLQNVRPLGFAENVNQMIDRAQASAADLYFLNNDVIFTKGWLTPLLVDSPHILSPLSNREVQYVSSVVALKTTHVLSMFNCGVQPVFLEDYLGNEAALEAIAEAHSRKVSGYMRTLALPFFCIKLPLKILGILGHMDSSFGVAGGEDFDYCLRAYLSGAEVHFALGSYVLHFGGKSSWDGIEERERQAERQSKFRKVFQEKWGDGLMDLILNENPDVLSTVPNGEGELHPRQIVLSLLGERNVSIKQ